MATIRDGTQKFLTQAYPGLQNRFRQLAQGQWPEAMFITCADSRIVPSLITQTGPGDLFIARNAGNLIPPYGLDDNSASAVEFAVAVLKVEHIVVCGHSGCGAMTCLIEPQAFAEIPSIRRWLRYARPTLDAVAHLCNEARLAEAIRHNARTQLDNLRTHPAVARALARGELTLHAWVYDIPSGEVQDVATCPGAGAA